MTDFGANGINLVYNTGTDAAPTWTGTAIQFGGSGGANELRWASSATTSQGPTVTSASWPFITRPTSGTSAVNQLWAFTADGTGLQINTYDGTNAKANVVRWSWDTSGSFQSAPQFSCFANNTHPTPVPGTQPSSGDGTAIVNGAVPDTGATTGACTSYLKINAWGSLIATTGTQLSAGSVGTAPTATTGAAGPTTTTAANWLNTGGAWTSAQGWLQAIQFGSTPAGTTANTWPWTLVLFVGVTLATGSALLPVLTFQYTF